MNVLRDCCNIHSIRQIWLILTSSVPKPKKFVAGKYFGSNKIVTPAVDGYFAALPETYFRDGIHLLEKS